MPSNSRQQGFDSDRQQIGAVYAKALLGAAGKGGQTAAVLEELRSLVDDVLDKLPKLEAALASPRVSLEAKLALIDRAFAGRMSPLLLNVLKVIARHGRLDCLRAIRRAARKLYNEEQGRVEVRLRSAAPLQPEILAGVVNRLQGKLGGELDVETEIDPELLGGLVVRIGDTVYDGSVSGQLRRMREEALVRARQEIRHTTERFTQETGT